MTTRVDAFILCRRSSRVAVLAACVAALAAASVSFAATSTPTIAIHPAQPAENDEVFAAHFDYDCGSHGPAIVRERTAEGWRIRVPVEAGRVVFLGDYIQPCLQSLGVLGPGRHEVVPVSEFPGDLFAESAAKALASVIVEITRGPRALEVDAWSYVRSMMTSLPLYDTFVPARIARIGPDRFAVIVPTFERSLVMQIGASPDDTARLDEGLPALKPSGLMIDSEGNLYAIELEYPTPYNYLAVRAVLWRRDVRDGRWARHVDYSLEAKGWPLGVRADGMVLTYRQTSSSSMEYEHRFSRFDPSAGWTELPVLRNRMSLMAFAYGGGPTFFALGAQLDDRTMNYSLVRLSPQTAAIVSSDVIDVDDGSTARPLPWSIATDTDGSIFVTRRIYTGNGSTSTYDYFIDRIDPAGNVTRIGSKVPTMVFAPGANGSFVTSTSAYSPPQFHRTAEAMPVAMGIGALSPVPICADPIVDASARPVAFPPCGGGEYFYSDEPKASSIAVTLPDARYNVEWGWDGVVLRVTRQSSGASPALFVDLRQLLPKAPENVYYTPRPMCMLATRDGSRLYVLVYQMVAGNHHASLLIDIERSTRKAAVVAMPPLMAVDMAMSPNGSLYVTTRFGEIMRMDRATGTWSTFGHLSSKRNYMHLWVDAAERVYVFDMDGLLTHQGSGARLTEFHNRALDHYFITADAAEASALASNPSLGFTATGATFDTIGAMPWSAPAGSRSPQPVCRFYGSVAPGPNSHFFTGDGAECEFLKSLQRSTPASLPRWNYEGIAFYSLVASGGAQCSDNEKRVDRFFNGGASRGLTPNHRYVADAATKATMTGAGWTAENAGFCVPDDLLYRRYAR